MPDTRPGSIVNEYYLSKVLTLSEEVGVTATEDIYDCRGTKLLAKGASVSRQLQERLIVHRLSKPLESSIAVENAVDGCQLADCALKACEESGALGAIVAASGLTAGVLRSELASLRFAPAMAMMLTMVDRGGEPGLRHVAEVATLALAFAARSGLPPDLRQVVSMAGALHDIGELYIDPELINASHVLTAEEWAHVIVHPHIGRLLIQDLGACPPSVGIAVAEHHERLNGTGYPRAMIAGQSSTAGQLVASAELISGLLHKPNALERAELALKIVGGEHPRMVSVLISQASRTFGAHAFEPGLASIDDGEIEHLSRRMTQASELAAQLAQGAMLAPKHLDLMLRTRERLAVVQRAFMSTGLDMRITALASIEVDHFEVFESELALREISWRVRDIGRDLAIQLGAARASIPQAEQLLALLC